MRQCEVYVHGIRAGILAENMSPREYVFRYLPEYLESRHREPVCVGMPLRKEPYRSPRLFPFFFNMLSEGDNRALQAAALRVDKEDDFGILLATCRVDTIGAVTVRPLRALY